MYNVGLVRQLCRDIYGAEQDAQREEQLQFLLQEITREDQDELRFRMAFLAETYLTAVRAETKAWGCAAPVAV
jgi:hypothetical protein